MRVPVVDSQGIKVRTCPPPTARHMIRKGQAVPRRDENGEFYIQLMPADARRSRRKARRRQCVSPPLSRRARRAYRIKRQNQLLSILAERRLVELPAPKVEDDGPVATCLDHLLVVDIESTCWPSAPPDGEEAEIIEIGVCVVDVQSGTRVDKASLLIRPEHSTLSPFCTELTTLTSEQVAAGMTFAQACALLQERFGAGERPWASYGDYDYRMFRKQCADRDIPYPFSPTHLNLKNLVALIHNLPYEVGLIDALRLLELPVEGTHHRGVDDAWNTALLASNLILQRRSELG